MYASGTARELSEVSGEGDCVSLEGCWGYGAGVGFGWGTLDGLCLAGEDAQEWLGGVAGAGVAALEAAGGALRPRSLERRRRAGLLSSTVETRLELFAEWYPIGRYAPQEPL